MPNVPLKLPPGMSRPGTVYDARGRWYDGNLVRWYDGVLQPIGGWRRAPRLEMNVGGAISDDGGVLTDETLDANNTTAGDVVLIPAAPALGDAFYIGFGSHFDQIKVNVSTAATDGAVTWEYWDGAAWAALAGLTDGTNGFKAAGESLVTFTRPLVWRESTVGGLTLFWVRARVSTAGTTAAAATRVRIAQGDLLVDGPARGMLAWRDNAQVPVLAVGTPRNLFAVREGALYNIAPADLAEGIDHATAQSGQYDSGAYGEGAYGEGMVGVETLEEATTWALDNYGQELLACSVKDGRILRWADPANPAAAAALANAPTGCCGVVVTPERFVVALGVSGDDRRVQWSDQENPTVWSPLSTNQAGDFTLSTPGALMAGRRGERETLLWTDADLWRMSFIGGEFVYGFTRAGTNCGAASRHAMAVADGRAYWMGQQGFFQYDGFVKPIPCEVSDYVFNGMNQKQISKVCCYLRSQFGEVTWHYPSSASSENDRYVTFNYREGFWYTGTLARTAGEDSAVFGYPLAADHNGILYRHEIANEGYPDADGSPIACFLESGPVELGQGEVVMTALQLIPDTNTLGSVTASIYSSLNNMKAETLHGPFSLSAPTPVRLTGRQVRLRVDGVLTNWRVGTMKLELVPGGRR